MAEMLRASRYQSYRACKCGRCQRDVRPGDRARARRAARAHEELAWHREAAEELAQDRDAMVEEQRQAAYLEKVHSHWAWQLLNSSTRS